LIIKITDEIFAIENYVIYLFQRKQLRGKNMYCQCDRKYKEVIRAFREAMERFLRAVLALSRFSVSDMFFVCNTFIIFSISIFGSYFIEGGERYGMRSMRI